MTEKIAIVGAGGFGRETLQIILDLNSIAHAWDLCGFVIVGDFPAPERVHGYPVHRGAQWIADNPDVHLVVAIGDPAARRKVVRRVGSYGNRFATLIHPRAWFGTDVAFGSGSIVCAGATLTTTVRLGSHVHVNPNCTIGHDAALDDFATLYPSVSVSGHVHLREGVECGVGTRLIPRVTVGEWSILGAGSVVTRSLPANITAVGVPARIIKTRKPGWHEVEAA
jgi:sugar O-acyltransferase (sialic acid O-acetyltransferase NeuD family)